MNYHVVNKYLEPYLKLKQPFLQHVSYFADANDYISISSINNKWSQLTDETQLKTCPLAIMLMTAANKNKQPECPWQDKLKSDKMLKQLHHPYTTGVVNEDGNINIKFLKEIMKYHFKYYTYLNNYYMKKSELFEYLKLSQLAADKFESDQTYWCLPSHKHMSQLKWHQFFDYFTDQWIDGQQSVSIDTFLQFYFESDVLYNRLYLGELPLLK